MDSLTAELIACICDHMSTLSDLLNFRAIARRYRDIVDRFGVQTAYQLCRTQIPAFDDGLLAVRIKRIPFEACCCFVPGFNEYSFIPTQDFLQAVMEGHPVPQGCPSIPHAPWIEELASVMDLYLLALAWHSTADKGINVSGSTLMTGTTITEFLSSLASLYIEAFVRTFIRVTIFTSLFGPRVFSEPVLGVYESHGPLLSGIDPEFEDIPDVVLEYLRKFPVYRLGDEASITRRKLSQGFFEWIYAQPQPSYLNLSGRVGHRDPFEAPQTYLSEDERNQVAIMQLHKVSFFLDMQSQSQRLERQPSEEAHVKALYNPTYTSTELLPIIVYRPKLRISCWSNPQEIIDRWARSEDIASIVIVSLHAISAPVVTSISCGKFSLDEANMPLCEALDMELSSRFGLKFEEERVDFLPADVGLLYPLKEAVPI